MQLIVLGMHRSGTSAVCRILNMMGAYFGPEGSSTGFNAENPKGFWERKDIRKMNDSALFAAKADWYKVADFNCTIVPDQIKEQYTKTAKSLVHELDAHRPWVIKEPRLCLLLPLFLPVLEVPVFIHVYRNTLQVAQSLKTRNGFPLSFGTALWEKYTLSALSGTRGLSNVLISYGRLIEKPVETVQNLFEELVSMGIQGLKCPIDKEINAFIDPSLFRERDDSDLMRKEYLNNSQIKLFRSLENNSVFNFKKISTLSAGSLDVLRNFEAQDEKVREFQKSISVKELESVKVYESLNKKLYASKQALTEKETEADNLNKKLNVSEKDLSELRKELDARNLALTEKESETDNLDEKLKVSEKNLGELRKELDARNQALKEKETEADRLNEKLNISEKNLSELLKEFEARTQVLNEKETEADNLNEKLNVSEKKLGELRKEIDSLNEVFKEKETEAGNLNEWLDISEKSLDELRRELDARNQVLKEKETETDILNEKLHISVKYLDELRKESEVRTLALKENETEAEHLNEKLCISEKSLDELRLELEARTLALTEKETEVDTLNEKLNVSEKETEADNLNEKLNASEKNLDELRRELDASNQVLKEKATEIKSITDKLNSVAKNLEAEEIKIDPLRSEIEESHQDLYQLSCWVEQMTIGISAILSSRRWRFGNAVGEILRKCTLKPKVPMTSEHLHQIMERFRTWKREYNKRKNSTNGTESIASLDFPINAHMGEKSFHKASPPSLLTEVLNVDLVVSVHNALYDAKKCLESIIRNTSGKYKLHIVNDGSDELTTSYLRRFSSNHRSCILLENTLAEGYTKAANKGLRVTTAGYVILLNSDTIVPPKWVERLIECGESDPNIGIVGPLSNAASYQSVPDMRSSDGDWAVNPLPIGFTVHDMANAVCQLSERCFPIVPFLNGFCYVIKREVIDKIGYFDEETFPKGYGEENDYSIRAAKAGFKLAIADNVYVYHAKSKSFSHETRRELSVAGRKALDNKHGADKITSAIDLLENNSSLDNLRQRLLQRLSSSGSKHSLRVQGTLRVLFLLIGEGGSGGSHSIVQEAQGMLELGVHAEVAVHRSAQDHNLEIYRNVPKSTFYFYDHESELCAHASLFEVVIATHFKTIPVLERFYQAASQIMPAYYIQDYEPWIVPEDRPDLVRQSEASYTAIPNLVCFAKTDWIRETVKKYHNVKVSKVTPSLDTTIYHPPISTRKLNDIVHVVAMVRPQTPRRAPRETMLLLNAIKKRHPEKVKITIFGNDPESKVFQNLPQKFELENRGILIREEVAELLASADVFVDMSTYQAFGRTGLEAMAVGCAPILPAKGGVYEYAVHRENALIVDTENMDEALLALDELVTDEDLRNKISRNALLTASRYSIRAAALSEILVIQESLAERLVTIVVPVYNAYEETRVCVESLLKYTIGIHRILLIDDCSPDERVWPMLQSFAEGHDHITAIRTDTNLGYTRTINKGCRLTEGDVVLLNSDTQVTAGWLQKLWSAAHSMGKVATVTPLSNAAGAFSVPINNTVNPIPEGFTIERMAELIAKLSPRLRPHVPTGSGFCMYVTRKALTEVGYFDEENFPRGYGEENDFCMQARKKGFIHLIEDSTFIYHKRTASFKETKNEIAEKSTRRLRKLHPDYKSLITEWIDADPLDGFRERIKEGIAEFEERSLLRGQVGSERPVILYVLHDGGGGTLHTSLDLLAEACTQYQCFLLKTNIDKWYLYSVKNGTPRVIDEYSFENEWRVFHPLDDKRLQVLEQICSACKPNLVHIRHLLANHPDIIQHLKDRAIPVVMSFHDFYAICPTIQLVDNTGKYCGGHCNTSKGDCRYSLTWFKSMQPLKNGFVRSWRNTVGAALSLCDAYVITSRTAEHVLLDHYPFLEKAKFNLIEHGRNMDGYECCCGPPVPSEPVRVVYFGALGKNKGIALVRAMLKRNREHGCPIHLHILGNAALPFEEEELLGCTYHGPYEREQLPKKLIKIQPSLAIIPSIWPETYCHSLTEAWAAGIPVVGSNLGAVGERIERHGGGWIIDPVNPDLWFEKIMEISKSPEEYSKQVQKIRSMHFRNIEEMAYDYANLYNWLIQGGAQNTEPVKIYRSK